MPFKWKVFKTALLGGLLLSICSFGGWIAFYIRIHSLFTIGTTVILFFVALVITILHTVFSFWILKNKFPDGTITNAIEGSIYMFSVALFIACLYIALYGSFFLKTILTDSRPPNNWIIFSKYLSIETVALSVIYTYIGINALLLIKTISKNRLDVIQKVSELGKL